MPKTRMSRRPKGAIRKNYPLRRKRSPEMMRVIKSVISLAWLASQFNPPICKQAISRWFRVPLDRVREVEAITGIPAHEIRPDTFRPPEETAAPRRRVAV